jgi:simple sugar transport system permease protein
MKQRTMQAGLSVMPILLSVAITALLIIIVGSNPLEVFEKIWQGAFRDTRAFGQVINLWIPLTLVSMGLLITFTAGLWNIGVEGQMIIGAVFASWGALYVQAGPLQIPLEIALAMLGGGLWAALVGVLKTRLGVQEIFGGVALNNLADIIAIYLIAGPWQPAQGGNGRATPQFPPEGVLPRISDNFPVSALALMIVAATVYGVILALRGTRWGLQLKATGKNMRSALLLGVPTERSALSALIACGALAGIAGAYRAIFTFGDLRQGVSGGIGFLGLLVVLMVSLRWLWGPPIVALAFAVILSGSSRLKVALQLDSSLAGVLQGFIVLTVLLFNGLRWRLGGRGETTAPSAESPAPVPQPEARP